MRVDKFMINMTYKLNMFCLNLVLAVFFLYIIQTKFLKIVLIEGQIEKNEIVFKCLCLSSTILGILFFLNFYQAKLLMNTIKVNIYY